MFSKVVAFIRDLYHTKDFIPLHAPVFTGNEKKYLADCIDSTFVSSVGKYVDRFEEMVAGFTGAKKAIVTVNGTNALHLALLMVGVKNETEVITQPLTFIATANAISYCGAKPVFLDVDRETLGLSPDALKKWLSENVELISSNKDRTNIEIQFQSNNPDAFNKNSGRRISACIPMHTFGHPCRIDEIISICNEYNIPVVEDAAESLGSFYKSKHTGTFGNFGILSFNGNKTITSGGGGMILTNDENIGGYIKHLTTQAKIPHTWEYRHDYVGYNYRMPNINAALGVAQMEKLDEFLEIKRKVANKYQRFFEDTEFQFFNEPENSRSNFWLNAIFLKDKEQRDAFLKYTNENGIMTRPAWELMNELTMFEDCETDDLFNAKNIVSRLVNIPSSAKT